MLNKFIRFSYFSLVFFLLLTFSCDNSVDSFTWVKHEEVEWNFLIYMGADNNLERFAIKNLEDIKKSAAAKNNEINILVLLDRSSGYDKSNDNWTDTKLLKISANSENINADIIKDYGELDMSDSNNLYNFLTLVEQYFPAKHTLLTMWGHGYGVYPDCKILLKEKGVIADYTTGYSKSHTISLLDLSNTIKSYELNTGKRIDIIHFDTCLMQSIEMCWQLKDLTDYIVGFETEAPGMGCNYYAIGNYLCNNVEPEKIAIFISDSFHEYYKNKSVQYVISVIKTENLSKINDEFNILCHSLMALNYEELELLRNNLTKLDSVYIEYSDLVELVDKSLLYNEILMSLSNLLKEIIISSYRTMDYESAYGLSINFPYTNDLIDLYKTDIKTDTENLIDFYKETDWCTFISEFYNL